MEECFDELWGVWICGQTIVRVSYIFSIETTTKEKPDHEKKKKLYKIKTVNPRISALAPISNVEKDAGHLSVGELNRGGGRLI